MARTNLIYDKVLSEKLSTSIAENGINDEFSVLPEKLCENTNDAAQVVEDYHKTDNNRLKSGNEKSKSVWKCKHCSYQTKASTSYRAHIRIHTGHMKTHLEKPAIVELECDMSFSIKKRNCDKKNTTNSGKKYETSNSIYPCHYCVKRYKSERKLRIHVMKLHSGLDSFLCPMSNCHFSFDSLQAKAVHMKCHLQAKAVHMKCQELFECELCNLKFTTKTRLSRHEEYCLGKERVSKSNLDDKRIVTNNELNNAISSISEIKDFDTESSQFSISNISNIEPDNFKFLNSNQSLYRNNNSSHRNNNSSHRNNNSSHNNNNINEADSIEFFHVDDTKSSDSISVQTCDYWIKNCHNAKESHQANIITLVSTDKALEDGDAAPKSTKIFTIDEQSEFITIDDQYE